MEINLDAYGIGLGLVLLPWMVGIIVSFAFNIVQKIGTIR